MLRFLPALAVLLVAIVVTWNIARRTAPRPAPPEGSSATHTATTPTREPAGSPVQTPTTVSTYRLAGTVVGDLRFAIVEAPDGTNDLYSIDEDVPGLGRLVAVSSNSATFEGRQGRFEMKLLAAPTPTPAAVAPEVAADDELDDAYLDEYDDEDLSDPGDDFLEREDEIEPDGG
jgi:hypothetical protein